jgi:drug/metabolite transporter (DMT)-like permease
VRLSGKDKLAVTGGQTVFALVLVAPAALPAGGGPALSREGWEGWATILLPAPSIGAVGFLGRSGMIRRWGGTRTSVAGTAVPIATATAGVPWLGETLTMARMFGGSVLVDDGLSVLLGAGAGA